MDFIYVAFNWRRRIRPLGTNNGVQGLNYELMESRKMTGVCSYSPFCKHCIGVSKNEIGETIIFCAVYDQWRNVTLGDCFNNCDAQNTVDGSPPWEWKDCDEEDDDQRTGD